MVTNETKCPIYTPCFLNVESVTAHTGRELGRFAPAEINLTFHNIYSSDSNRNTSTKDGADYLACYETTY